MKLDPQQSIKKYPLNGFLLHLCILRIVHIFDSVHYSQKIEFFKKFSREIFMEILLSMGHQIPSFLGKPPRTDTIKLRINRINPSGIICLQIGPLEKGGS
jgi:hypothetical protein